MQNFAKDKTEVKITFIGDIMCELPLLKASRTKNGYNFYSVFSHTQELFRKSDYVVGNLETVFAGKDMEYTNTLYSFNTPDEFLDALKTSGIDLFLTANNHCLDRGIYGLQRTLKELDRRKMDHIGTYLNSKEREKVFIKNIRGMQFAFLNYTYGTGIKDNHVILEEKDLNIVNLLIPQHIGSPIRYNLKTSNAKSIKKFLGRIIPENEKLKLKRILRKPVGVPRTDEMWDELLDPKLLNTLKKDIQNAKNNADYVIVNIHNGGQFNARPGKYSEFIMEFCAKAGADLIIGNHPHVVQKCELIDGVPCAFSLGNYSISPSTPYILFDNLPQYSIAWHMIFDSSGICIDRSSFSVLKILEDNKHHLTVVDTYELYNQIPEKERHELQHDVKTICEKFVLHQLETFKIEKEYKIFGE